MGSSVALQCLHPSASPAPCRLRQGKGRSFLCVWACGAQRARGCVARGKSKWRGVGCLACTACTQRARWVCRVRSFRHDPMRFADRPCPPYTHSWRAAGPGGREPRTGHARCAAVLATAPRAHACSPKDAWQLLGVSCGCGGVAGKLSQASSGGCRTERMPCGWPCCQDPGTTLSVRHSRTTAAGSAALDWTASRPRGAHRIAAQSTARRGLGGELYACTR